jgi:hypothetical protein
VSSTFVREAASTSSRSTNRPSVISRQAEHSPQGVEETPRSQFRHFARRRASVVLPTPRVPVGVMQAIALERVDERAQHMLLADHLVEGLGPPAARQYLVSHCGESFPGEVAATVPMMPAGGNPGQPHPGTRINDYRCSLPGLAGFIVRRCEGTGRGHH